MAQRIVSISPSGLNNASCIRKYKWSQIDRYRRRYQPSYFDKGSLIHRYLEEYYAARKEGIHPDLAMAKSLTTVAPEIILMKLSLDEAADMAKIFREYVDFYKSENFEVLETESIFSFVIHEDEELKLIVEGRKDLVVNIPTMNGGKLKVVFDHKSRSRTSKVNGLSYAYPIYAMASGCDTVIDNEIGTQDKIPANGRFKRQTISYSKKQLDERRENIVYRVKSLMSHIDRDYFPPDYSSCDKFFGCHYASVCNADIELRDFILNTEFEIVQHDLMEEKPNV